MLGISYAERVGTTVNDLEILEITGKRNTGHRVKIMCRVKCSCGNEFETLIESVISGQTTSCGCKRKKHTNSALRKIYTGYINSAKKRNYSFNIPYDEFEKIVTDDCFYCGSKPKLSKELYGDNIIYNGIDRVNNEVGYEKDNIVTCCIICNRAKHAFTQSEFIEWLDGVVAWRQN